MRNDEMSIEPFWSLHVGAVTSVIESEPDPLPPPPMVVGGAVVVGADGVVVVAPPALPLPRLPKSQAVRVSVEPSAAAAITTLKALVCVFIGLSSIPLVRDSRPDGD